MVEGIFIIVTVNSLIIFLISRIKKVIDIHFSKLKSNEQFIKRVNFGIRS